MLNINSTSEKRNLGNNLKYFNANNSIKNNVTFLSPLDLFDLNWNKPMIFQWFKFLNEETKIDFFTSKNKIFDFLNNTLIDTKSKSIVNYQENKEQYEVYSICFYSHGQTSLYLRKRLDKIDQWDEAILGWFFIKRNWKHKEKFIEIISNSLSIWTQLNAGYFNWVYDLSNEEVEEYYAERFYQDEEKKCNCKNCILSIDEMKDKINDYEIEIYGEDIFEHKFELVYFKEQLKNY